jgi:hypothetical protein
MGTLPTGAATQAAVQVASTPEAMVDANRKRLDAKGDLARLMEADVVTKRVAPQVLGMMGVLERGLIMSDAIMHLHRLLDDATMGRVMALMNTPLGFKTDKAPPKFQAYDVHTVRKCVVQALLMGLNIVGNEFNIIAESTYCTREGFTRLLREYPGLTDLSIDPDVPDVRAGQAIVTVKASWKLNGVPASMEARIPVRVNAGMGDDAILGKTYRKVMCRIYNRITGSELSDGEVGDPDLGKAAPTPEPKSEAKDPEPSKVAPIVQNKAQGLAAKLLAEKGGLVVQPNGDAQAVGPEPKPLQLVGGEPLPGPSESEIDELLGDKPAPEGGRGKRQR